MVVSGSVPGLGHWRESEAMELTGLDGSSSGVNIGCEYHRV